MKGYTRSQIVHITRGDLHEHKVGKILHDFEVQGWHGWVAIRIIPVERIEEVKKYLLDHEYTWDDERFAKVQPIILSEQKIELPSRVGAHKCAPKSVIKSISGE